MAKYTVEYINDFDGGNVFDKEFGSEAEARAAWDALPEANKADYEHDRVHIYEDLNDGRYPEICQEHINYIR